MAGAVCAVLNAGRHNTAARTTIALLEASAHNEEVVRTAPGIDTITPEPWFDYPAKLRVVKALKFIRIVVQSG